MVALLVLFTIVGCLVVDSIVLSVRERRAVMAGERKLTGAESMVFAQDGGKPVEKETETEADRVEKES
ncbi:MAG: hypothetical protein GXO70_06495 [Acidobacteria bacterium]|nr:hypothetical protein [Acidobacteriota bacterium]